MLVEPNEPVEIKGQVLKPGTVICALTRNLGEKAVSEIPLGPNSEGQVLSRRWLVPGQSNSLSVTQPTNRYGGYMPFGTEYVCVLEHPWQRPRLSLFCFIYCNDLN